MRLLKDYDLIFLCLFFTSILHAEEKLWPEIKLGGFVQAQYRVDASTGVKDEFILSHTRFNVQVKIDELWSAQLRTAPDEFSAGTGFRQAYLEFKPFQRFSVKLGQFKIPTNREAAASIDSLPFANRAISVQELYPNPTAIDIGVMAEMNHSLHDAKWLPSEWKLGTGLVNGAGANNKDDTNRKTPVGRFFVRWPDLGIGGSWDVGDRWNSVLGAPVTKNRFGGELEVGSENQAIRAEFWNGQDETVHSEGWFVSADMALPLLSPWAYEQIEWLKRFHMGLRIETWNPNLDLQGDRLVITSLVLHYFASNTARLSLNWDHKTEETADLGIPNDQIIIQTQINF